MPTLSTGRPTVDNPAGQQHDGYTEPGPSADPLPSPADSAPDPAAAALARARSMARGAGWRSGGQRSGGRAGQAGQGGRSDGRAGQAGRSGRLPRRRGGYSGPGPDDRDPQLLGAMAGQIFREHGWDAQLASHRVLADWAGLVGADIAAQCTPVSLVDGELKVSASSSAWATQLRLMSSALLAKIVAQVGPTVVRRIVITGPTAPSWKHGLWSVRGRGPRDTYG